MRQLALMIVAMWTCLTGCTQESEKEIPSVRVHTIGDSTMADYAENTTRTRGWGEMLQEFFTPDVQVLNYARGGRSSRSFYEEGRWQRVKEAMQPDDYVFIQFAHNDEKEGGKDGADMRGTAPWTTYKSYLERYVDETRELGGKPVFITPIIRRYFKEGRITPKGCHDLGIQPDDSTLNYVRVMKHVAREKQVPLVDITAITKQFVEELGEETTVNKIYVPTDGTHTRATGAACYAKLVVEELKRQKILADYICTDIPWVFNPTQPDFDTVFVGDKAVQCIDLIGLQLSPAIGTLTLNAPEGMGLSTNAQAAPVSTLELPYSDSKLWDQQLFLHFLPEHAGNYSAPLTMATADLCREINVKAVGKEITRRTETTLTCGQILMRGIKQEGNNYTIEGETWPADIDEDGKRYVEFILENGNKTLALRQLSFNLTGDCCYRIAYARGKDFYPRTDVGEEQKPAPGTHAYPLNVTVSPNERLHIRLFPWSLKAGKMQFEVSDWQLQGIIVE